VASVLNGMMRHPRWPSSTRRSWWSVGVTVSTHVRRPWSCSEHRCRAGPENLWLAVVQSATTWVSMTTHPGERRVAWLVGRGLARTGRGST